MESKRVRAYFAFVGGSAVAAAAALTVMTSVAPESPINVCALLPSWGSCKPLSERGNQPVHKNNLPTITQVKPNSGS
jgi:hypothetical protein